MRVRRNLDRERTSQNIEDRSGVAEGTCGLLLVWNDNQNFLEGQRTERERERNIYLSVDVGGKTPLGQ